VRSLAHLSLREARANWRLNVVFGAILLAAIATQLYAGLTRVASEQAVATYGAKTFGAPETYRAPFGRPLHLDELTALQARIAAIHRSYPWFSPATSVEVSVQYRPAGGGGPFTQSPLALRAVDAAWAGISLAVPPGDPFDTVVADGRTWPALVLAAERATVPGGPGGTEQALRAVDLRVSPTAPERGGELPGVPVVGVYAETNKSLAADGLVSDALLPALGLDAAPVTLFWRCQLRCADERGLVELAVGTALGSATPSVDLASATRIDDALSFGPVLDQLAGDGHRYAVVVVLLGAAAVTALSTAAVAMRSPRLSVLRSLGASRGAVASIVLLENVLTAAVVAGLAVVLGVLATAIDPNRFNQIAVVDLSSLHVPVGLYAGTATLTVAVGILTGLLPAARAYRGVVDR
jgi:putative ABC transport system permease protein